MKPKITKLAITSGPDRLELAAAFLAPQNTTLYFGAENYDYVLGANILSIERWRETVFKVKGFLYHAGDGLLDKKENLPRYAFTGIYSVSPVGGIFDVEELTGDGVVKPAILLEMDEEDSTEATGHIDALREILQGVVSRIERDKAHALLKDKVQLKQKQAFVMQSINHLNELQKVLLLP